MSLLSPDLKFKGCSVISTTFHLFLFSGSNSNDKLSLEIFSFSELENWGGGARLGDSADRGEAVRESAVRSRG